MILKLGLIISVVFCTKTEAESTQDILEQLRTELKSVQRRLDVATAVQKDLRQKYDDALDLLKRRVKRSLMCGTRQKGRADELLLKRFSRQTDPQADPDIVAFTAELTTKLTHLPLGTTIVFNRTVLNTQHYNGSTGVFTSPTSGLYLFAAFVESSTSNEAVLDIKVDGVTYSSSISEPSVTGEDDSGGNLVLVYLKKGVRVWVETSTVKDQSLWPWFTTFSGVLIHKHQL